MNISLKHCLLALLTLCLSSMSPALAYTVTLHPGLHGSITGANSNNDYVTTVASGAAFPTVVVTPATGWTFSGWNPAAPTTVTGDFTATAEYMPPGISIADDFNDGVLNTSIWTTRLPRGDSIAREENSGYFHLGGLGSLITKAEYNPVTAPISITVRLSIPSYSDGIYFETRSDGGNVQNGIVFNCGDAYDGYGITISRVVNGTVVYLAHSTRFYMSLGSWNDLRITDDGTHLAVFMNNNLLVSANDSTVFSKNHVVFANRPNEGWMSNNMYLDSVGITVTNLPPPTHTVTLHPGAHGSITEA
ncbi:MAG: hypothetical protein WCP35_22040, partial [Verrucomicrobiota bacterium]